MSYHRPRPRALSGVSTRLPSPRVVKSVYLGSMGDTASPGSTLSDPTVSDQALQWQGQVLAQLQAGVEELKRSDRYKILQIIATVSIPLSAAIWKAIFRRGSADPTV